MSAPTYITLDDIKATLKISNTDSDPDLTVAINAASRAVDQECNRPFYADETADVVRRFLPDNPGFCIIDDLAEITSLEAQSDTWTVDVDFYLEPSNAALDGFPYTAIRTIARPFIYTKSQVPAGWVGFDGRIAITGKWGWPTDPPPAVVQATTIIASKLFKRPRDAPFSVIGVGVDNAAVRIGSYDPEIQLLLGPFKRELWFG